MFLVTRSLGDVMRLLAVLTLVTPVAIGVLVLTHPEITAPWIEARDRAMVSGIAAVVTASLVTAILTWLVVRLRFGRFVTAAEHLVAGDYTIEVGTGGGGLEARLGTAINGIAAALTDTHDRATIDRLTGVANRQALLTDLFSEVERAGRYARPLCVAFVDIDHFKAVNDTYGHAAGDIVLRGVAQTISENLRASDLIGRYGGEEFMLILTETDVEEAAALSEKLRILVERRRFSIEGNANLSVTISIGIAGGTGQHIRTDALVRDADAAMYSAKSLGRNQTYIFEEPDEDARVPRAPISDLGRARAMDIGRKARNAATDMLTSLIAPLPHYRGQPSALIAAIVVEMGRQLELSDVEVDRLRIAALLHDVGKVAVPDEILDKPSALTSAEWRTVVQHPRIGQVILEHAAALRDAVPIILHHHERYAGHGYPYGLRANEIPLGARIVAIADAYDAMTHDRPYKRAISHDAAIAELRTHAGVQFDPELVALFCDLYAANPPQPDPTVLSITEPTAIVTRRRARKAPAEAEASTTLAAGGGGLVELERPTEPRPPNGRGDGPRTGKRPSKRGIAAG